VEGAAYDSRIGWANISSVRETKRFFFIRVWERSGWTIPQHAIADEATRIALREILRANVKGKVKIRS
jgi:hypothetical protein